MKKINELSVIFFHKIYSVLHYLIDMGEWKFDLICLMELLTL